MDMKTLIAIPAGRA